eukprot:COSAG06_NODE_8653_length_2105_cov_24.995513_1_plen_76_part_10
MVPALLPPELLSFFFLPFLSFFFLPFLSFFFPLRGSSSSSESRLLLLLRGEREDIATLSLSRTHSATHVLGIIIAR